MSKTRIFIFVTFAVIAALTGVWYFSKNSSPAPHTGSQTSIPDSRNIQAVKNTPVPNLVSLPIVSTSPVRNLPTPTADIKPTSAATPTVAYPPELLQLKAAQSFHVFLPEKMPSLDYTVEGITSRPATMDSPGKVAWTFAFLKSGVFSGVFVDQYQLPNPVAETFAKPGPGETATTFTLGGRIITLIKSAPGRMPRAVTFSENNVRVFLKTEDPYMTILDEQLLEMAASMK